MSFGIFRRSQTRWISNTNPGCKESVSAAKARTPSLSWGSNSSLPTFRRRPTLMHLRYLQGKLDWCQTNSSRLGDLRFE